MEAAQLLALCRVKGADWHFIAREAQRPGGPESLLTRRRSEQSPESEETLQLLEQAEADLPRHEEWAAEQLRATTADGIRITTVLDDDYPMNLRTIFNLPPFLFYRGELRPDDAWSVAVVGTRNASDAGIARARKLSDALAEQGVTVLSGLARGIDTAAHEATLKAGGRTVAVMGTGIRKVYPAGNTELAERIAENGALVSQFWPDAPPTSYNFPRRNVVTSGPRAGYGRYRGHGDVGREDAGSPGPAARSEGVPALQPRPGA